jgi:hypothetical protein
MEEVALWLLARCHERAEEIPPLPCRLKRLLCALGHTSFAISPLFVR